MRIGTPDTLDIDPTKEPIRARFPSGPHQYPYRACLLLFSCFLPTHFHKLALANAGGLYLRHHSIKSMMATSLEKELRLIRQRLDSIEDALAEEMSEDDKKARLEALKEHKEGKTVPFVRKGKR